MDADEILKCFHSNDMKAVDEVQCVTDYCVVQGVFYILRLRMKS